ncbi:hypothetical protein ATI61_11992 [Archangium gephyra]|uniref:Uncharacterized protein n=1 Tax=Archangium gephyra TaxID=48 RepID=A0AAC8TF55_9BACT|nr:hypothetical protein [Archangium gephyra]AKJ03658.1 Hypothetical protein AA314_05284 [Archangium gephyra]REG22562.1 hypothetical protein ATI61_11992 [Archangium gephyra]
MLASPPPRFRLLLPALVCALVIHGAYGASRMGPTAFAAFVLLVLAIAAMRWRHGATLAFPARGMRRSGTLPEHALARLAHEEEPSRQYPVQRGATPTPFPPRRTFWSRVKIWFGSTCLLVCGLWWMLLGAMLFMPDPSPALDGLFTNSSLTLITVSLLLTVLFGVILRSGLRGPSDPLAPKDWSRKDGLRDQPYVPHSPGAYAGGARRGKRHLRLVRGNTP